MAIMIGVTYLIRVIPMTLLRKQIKNEFITSFLYYVPYVTLSVMTFPAIVEATQSPIAGLLAFIIGMFSAWKGANLFQVAVICCVVVFISEIVLV
ncbi:MAG: AzlD domain-containing protein [Bacteroidales bacterium]|nr:AzlD domain-containing protein [Bacteroidales bacterium]